MGFPEWMGGFGRLDLLSLGGGCATSQSTTKAGLSVKTATSWPMFGGFGVHFLGGCLLGGGLLVGVFERSEWMGFRPPPPPGDTK